MAEQALGNAPGAVVVMDPRNGDLLAMVSAPAFDLTRFTEPMDRDEWLRLVRDPAHPLLNRVFQSEYPPGSIFKLAVAAAALQEGVITPLDRLPCPPSVEIGGRGSGALVSSCAPIPAAARRFGSPPEVAGRVDVSPAVLGVLREGLWSAVNDGGTGAGAAVPGVAVAGKTGTAQLVRDSDSRRGQDHAWFAGYAPADDPRVVVVLVERGGAGGRVAAPIAGEILREIFRPAGADHAA